MSNNVRSSYSLVRKLMHLTLTETIISLSLSLSLSFSLSLSRSLFCQILNHLEDKHAFRRSILSQRGKKMSGQRINVKWLFVCPACWYAAMLRQRGYTFMQALGRRKTNMVCMRWHVVIMLSLRMSVCLLFQRSKIFNICSALHVKCCFNTQVIDVGPILALCC